jgi:hypothetical protein
VHLPLIQMCGASGDLGHGRHRSVPSKQRPAQPALHTSHIVGAAVLHMSHFKGAVELSMCHPAGVKALHNVTHRLHEASRSPAAGAEEGEEGVRGGGGWA